ncbi:MAG: peptide-methionine (S)-S-oxide reductase MsrA [Candidatus Cloacimonetes bacterium]|nr:peptide-methionine (S)-S-oxide reductase MsrA [Candidatus Cloacimonadota bacterium]
MASEKEIMFGAGCFWGVEYAFRKVSGVVDASVGYSGGHTEFPTYHDVCNKDTGHAEVVWIKYDESKVSLQRLLEIFYKIHDPTQINRQGPDVGTQYRSAIYYYEEEQGQFIRKFQSGLELSERFSRPIATEIKKATKFWKAEDYHQQYNQRTGRACHINLDFLD